MSHVALRLVGCRFLEWCDRVLMCPAMQQEAVAQQYQLKIQELESQLGSVALGSPAARRTTSGASGGGGSAGELQAEIDSLLLDRQQTNTEVGIC